MAKIISVSIDITKIKETISGKNGAKYANLTINLNDTKDKFDNDCSVILSQSKEERESKAPKTYIGNGRVVWSNETPNNETPF